MDIQNLKEMVSLVASGVNAGIKIAEDKKISMDDMQYVFAILQRLPAAVDGADKIPAELADMDSVESSELLAHVMKELSLGDVKTAQIVDKSLRTLLAIFDLVKAIKG